MCVRERERERERGQGKIRVRKRIPNVVHTYRCVIRCLCVRSNSDLAMTRVLYPKRLSDAQSAVKKNCAPFFLSSERKFFLALCVSTKQKIRLAIRTPDGRSKTSQNDLLCVLAQFGLSLHCLACLNKQKRRDTQYFLRDNQIVLCRKESN